MKVPRLEPIAPRVWLLRGGLTRAMNVYLLEHEGQVVVFDAGEKGMARAIAAAAARLGGIRQVVLGHGDTDHRGSAPELSKVAPVVCHPDAVEQAQGSGGRGYWHMERLPPAIRLLHRFTHRFVRDGRLAALRPKIVGVGHLGPMTGPGVVEELEAAAR